MGKAAIGGAIGGALFGVGGGPDSYQGLLGSVSDGFGAALTTVFGKLGPYVQAGVSGAIGNALTQGAGMLFGMQKKFSWREVAASAVAGTVGYGAGKMLNPSAGRSLGNLAKRTLNGVITGAAHASVTGGKIHFEDIVTDAFGNAIGNSIVEKIEPQAATTSTSKRSGANAMTSEDVLEEVQVTATRRELGVNPQTDFTPGMVSGDAQRAIEATQTASMPSDAQLEEIVITGRHWNDTDYRNLEHLTTPFLYGGGGMVDDHGEEIARRTMQMTDMGFDPLRQRQDLAILNEAFTPWGQAIDAGIGIYNTGVKALAGAASLFDLPNGLDHTVATQNSIRNALDINLDSPLANAIAPNFANLSPAARVGLELVGDGLALAPALAGLRSVTADMSSVSRALQMPLSLDLQPGTAMYSGIPIKPQSLFAPEKASFGFSESTDYRATFFAANPDLEGQVVVHHAVEQQVLTRYPGLVSEGEMHSLENLRGIPNELNPDLHLSQIRRDWNQFYRQNANPTRQQLLDKATEIDSKYGSQFNPPR